MDSALGFQESIRSVMIEISINILHDVKKKVTVAKGALAWYGKLTWESAHTWILKILCYLIVWGIT